MSKKILFALLIILFMAVAVVSANSMQGLMVSMTIDEDYGVVFPQGVLRLDRLVFEWRLKDGRAVLLPSGNVDIGRYDERSKRPSFTLCYYGNLGSPYSVKLEAEVLSGWVAAKGYEIPLFVSFDQAAEYPFFEYMDTSSAEVYMTVYPDGVKNGIPLVELNLDWDDDLDIRPGRYTADILLTLSVY